MKTPCLLLLSLMFATLGAHAQKFVTEDNEPGLQVEFRDGNEWGNLDLNGLRVGIGTHVLKTDYGKFYMLSIAISNDTHNPYTFDPLTVRAYAIHDSKKGSKAKEMTVYSAEKIQKKIREEQTLCLLLFGAAGAASPLTMAAMMPGFKDDYRTHVVGYLKKNTVNPGETVCGYLYITYAKGDRMKATIPFAGKEYTFVWDVTKPALHTEYF